MRSVRRARLRLARAAVVGLLALAVAACEASWEPAFDEEAEPGSFDTFAIAKPEVALTFTREIHNGEPRILLLTHFGSEVLRGIDLTAMLGSEADDPLLLYNALGYDGVLELMRKATPHYRVFSVSENLIAPVDLRSHHIAAGTNFPEHADDAGVEDGPFLFAKLVTPTKPYDTVSAGSALLDYEVEIAVVTLKPLAQGEKLDQVGLVLCNDFTDRATLFRKLDPFDVASGKGFTTGKSFPGYLPIGNLFVVPRDFRSFVAGLELRLYVNDRLRQKAPTTEMVWDFDEIVAHVWEQKDRRWEHDGGEVSLLGESAVIPDRTLILSGTPHGTVFAGVAPKHYFEGLWRWLAGGWDRSPPTHVVDAYIDDARAARAYLQAGDRVEIRVEHMGAVRTTVVP